MTAGKSHRLHQINSNSKMDHRSVARVSRYAPSSHLISYYLVIDQHGIVDRFPRTDRKSCPIPANITDFCNFPSVMVFDQSRPEPKFFTFATITCYGARLYGACLRLFESSIQGSDARVYNPKILMILSESSFFSVFEVFLGYFYLASRKKLDGSTSGRVSIEEFLMELEDLQISSDQCQQIMLKFGADIIPITRRSRFVPPALNTSFSILFNRLSVPVIALVLQHILCEKQIMFVSEDISILTPIQDLLLSLVHPLKWYHLYLPITSKAMFEHLLHYKYAFISGTHKDIFRFFEPDSVLAINLDDGNVMSRVESQLYHCEEIDQLCSVLNQAPEQKSEIYGFQCKIEKVIISLLQNSIRPKASSTISMKAFGKQIRASLSAQLFIADYRKYVPGDLRLVNLQSYFDSQLDIPRMEKVEPMFEPKIYSKEMRDYTMLYESQIIPINDKRLEKIQKNVHSGHKHYLQVKENEGKQVNQSRKRTLSNGATVMATEFCNDAATALWQANPGHCKLDDIVLKSGLAEHEIAETVKIHNDPLKLNTTIISMESSSEYGKWASNSSDTQSIDGQEYLKGHRIDSNSIKRLETRIMKQNDSNSENEADIFEGISENENEHDANTAYSMDSNQGTTSSSTLHCLQERNEFNADELETEFQRDEKNHASIFAQVPQGKLANLLRPESANMSLTLPMYMERAKQIANCKCD